MTSRRTILVDIGNSAAKLAAVANAGGPPNPTPCRTPLRPLRFDLRNPSWAGDVVSWAGGESPLRWVVASVNDPASHMLRQRLAAESPEDLWYELNHDDIRLQCELRNPAAVGIDRLLSASAAWDAAVSSEENCSAVVSIDAGSAVTVDLVHRGTFIGGAILPGLQLQFSSLTRGTDRLPAVTHDGVAPLEIPGRDTESAMRAGVILGLSGGIDRLIERYSDVCQASPQVYLTGGDATVIEPLLRHSVNRREDLVLSAIADIASALGYHLLSE